MADKYIIDGQTLSDIADEIRLKRDIATPIKPEDMPLQISLIDGGGGGQDVLEHICDLSVDMTQGTYGSLSGTVPVPLESGVFYLIRPVRGTITATSGVRNPYAVIISQTFTVIYTYNYNHAMNAVNASNMTLNTETGQFTLLFSSSTARMSAGCQYQLFKVHIYVGEG